MGVGRARVWMLAVGDKLKAAARQVVQIVMVTQTLT